MSGWIDAFEGAGIPWRFTGTLDNVNSTPVIAERYRLPSALIRTFVYDSISRLDDFARELRGYVGEVMNYVCEELRSPSMKPLRRATTSGVNEGEKDVCGGAGG
jgi:hypothetical protein